MDKFGDTGREAGYDDASGELPLSRDLAEPFFIDGAAGAAVACYAWRQVPAGAPALLWGHANGFNAGCYAPVLQRLARHFRVFAFDARGEGASAAPVGEPAQVFIMDGLAADLQRIVAAVRARIGPATPLHYASHSMCGNAAILLEARRGQAPFTTLTLFEPPIHPLPEHPSYDQARDASAALVRWASKRREHFADRAALRQTAQGIATFTRFAPDMLDAYVTAAAHPTDAGDLRLYCPGAVEAAYYRYSPGSGMFAAVAGVMTPTLLFSSDPAATDRGHTWAPDVLRAAAATMANATYDVIADGRHLMVQEDPDQCVAQVLKHAGIAA